MHVPTSLKDKKFYILPTEYLYILYVSQKKKHTEVLRKWHSTVFYKRGDKCSLRGTSWVFK
jgi:hypothetical protein